MGVIGYGEERAREGLLCERDLWFYLGVGKWKKTLIPDIYQHHTPREVLIEAHIEDLTVLDEANFLGIAAEALSAAHESILSYNCMRITTDTAGTRPRAVVLRVSIPDVRVTHLSSSEAISESGGAALYENPNCRTHFVHEKGTSL